MQALTDDDSSLALDDADDFGDSSADEDDSPKTMRRCSVDPFTELGAAGPWELSDASPHVDPTPFSADLLPDTAYMLVDKVVELDARPLKEFPDLGLHRRCRAGAQGLYLFASPRAAKAPVQAQSAGDQGSRYGCVSAHQQFLLARGIHAGLDGLMGCLIAAADSEA